MVSALNIYGLLSFYLFILLFEFATSLALKKQDKLSENEVFAPGMHITVRRGGSGQKVNLEDVIYSTIDSSPVLLFLSPDRPETREDMDEWFETIVNDSAIAFTGEGVRLKQYNLGDISDSHIQLDTTGTGQLDTTGTGQLDNRRMDLNYSPVLFFIAAGRVFLHSHSGIFGKSEELKERNLWLKERINSRGVKVLDSTNLPYVLDDKEEAPWFIVLYDSKIDDRCRRPDYFSGWMSNLALSLTDVQVNIASLDLAVDDHSIVKQSQPRYARSRKDRQLFPTYSPVRLQIEYRLSEHVIWAGCPQFVVIANHTFTVFYKDSSDKAIRLGRYISRSRMTSLGYELRQFIRKSVGNKSDISRQAVKGPFTDIKLEFMTLEKDSHKRVQDPAFIIIGVTAGLGILALAVSIFWGLKSSS